MIKKRLIPLMLSSGDVLVKGKNFGQHRVVGRMESMLQIWSDQEIDELLLLDISSEDDSSSFLKKVDLACSVVNFPITVGGKIGNLEYARELLRSGADKISICSKATEDLSFVENLASEFGSQAVVIIVDYKWVNGSPEIYSKNASVQILMDMRKYLTELQIFGAGEIVLQNIEQEGSKRGLDERIVSYVEDLIAVPLILSGGAGNFDHLKGALQHESVSGVACGSLFYFGDNSPIRARSYLRNSGIAMRKAR